MTAINASRYRLTGIIAVIALAVGLGSLGLAQGQQPAVKNDQIRGVVTGANGPEAGVWVIAETNDLPTRYAKIVDTDGAARARAFHEHVRGLGGAHPGRPGEREHGQQYRPDRRAARAAPVRR